MFFKSKEEKAIEQRMLRKRTASRMSKYIAELEPKKKAFIDKAKEARLKGAADQERLAKNALKQVMAQQRMAERMLLNFEITAQMKDLTELSGEFMKGMTSVSKEMSRLTDGIDFGAATKEFSRAMAKSQVQSEQMSVFLDQLSDSFDVVSADGGSIADSEVDALIDGEAAGAESAMDKEIESKLRAVQQAMKE